MDLILDFGFSHSGIGVAQKALKNCLRINHPTYNNIVGCGICAKSTLSMKLIWDISTSFSLKILNWTKEYLVEYSFEWKVQCTYLCSMYYWGRYPENIIPRSPSTCLCWLIEIWYRLRFLSYNTTYIHTENFWLRGILWILT